MTTTETTCGEEIAYETTTDTLSEGEERLYTDAIRDIEDSLAIIAEIQNERVAGDEVKEPLTRAEANTILEVGASLERSLAVLTTVEANL